MNQRARSEKVVVVGRCASGKSTLVNELKRYGVDAYVSAQEHSDIATLWRHREPDVVILLDVDLPTLRSRRSPDWAETIYNQQSERLRDAREHADLTIDTREAGINQSVARVLRFLETRSDSAET